MITEGEPHEIVNEKSMRNIDIKPLTRYLQKGRTITVIKKQM
jgi:hypothetical protein